jgi:hypothetical protein
MRHPAPPRRRGCTRQPRRDGCSGSSGAHGETPRPTDISTPRPTDISTPRSARSTRLGLALLPGMLAQQASMLRQFSLTAQLLITCGIAASEAVTTGSHHGFAVRWRPF